jgi:uncharacterized protein
MYWIFHAIGFTVTALNLFTFLALLRRIRTAWPKRAMWIGVAVGVPFWLLLHPGIFLMLGGVSWLTSFSHQVPDSLGLIAMTFQFAVWVYGALLLIKFLPAKTVAAVQRLRRMFRTEESGTEDEKDLIDHDRRQAMAKAALVLPAAVVATAAGGALAARQTPKVLRLEQPAPPDMTQLKGITIAQVSDVHVGSYMDGPRLDEIRDAMNSLNADYHVITGDLIDNHEDQLEEATRFLRGLRPRRRTFMCMGNHEYIAARNVGTPYIVDALRETGVTILIDEAEKVEIGGAHIWMAGLDYPPQRTLERLHNRTVEQGLERILEHIRDDGAPRILLTHHPRTFVQARELPFDLALAGHTHGGQINLGRIGDYALTPVLPFEYYHNGFYEHNGRRLYVNAGAGGWLPVRINCPPEITLITLT